jgi:hypothetical protein
MNFRLQINNKFMIWKKILFKINNNHFSVYLARSIKIKLQGILDLSHLFIFVCMDNSILKNICI